MSEKIDITIIIISYNTKDFLIDCLQSLDKHISNIRYDVIRVDNASVDGSPEIIKKRFPQHKLIENYRNYGFAKANNLGFKIAKGKAIFMLNSDTIFFEKGIKRVREKCINKKVDEYIKVYVLISEFKDPHRSCQENPYDKWHNAVYPREKPC